MKYSLILISLLFISCSDSETTERAESEERSLEYTSEVTFIDVTGNEVSTVEVAVADDDDSRTEGLMDVTNLPEDAGMLFIFDENRERNFWMANTPLSLDILFVNEDLEIVRIHQNTNPYSQDSIPSEAPAKYVVEVNAGYTLKHDITEGDSIRIEE
ncbi:MAG: DUF192 domain-containing protein [Balneolaceae bacterium]